MSKMGGVQRSTGTGEASLVPFPPLDLSSKHEFAAVSDGVTRAVLKTHALQTLRESRGVMSFAKRLECVRLQRRFRAILNDCRQQFCSSCQRGQS